MLVFSMMPALQAIRAQVADSLRQSGRTLTAGRNRQWLRSALATTQIALALALLFASALALTAADRTVNGVLGFDKNNVLVGAAGPAERTYADAEKRRQFVTEVIDAMRSIPAVTDDRHDQSSFPPAFGDNSRQFFPRATELKESRGPLPWTIRARHSGLLPRAADSADARPLVR